MFKLKSASAPAMQVVVASPSSSPSVVAPLAQPAHKRKAASTSAVNGMEDSRPAARRRATDASQVQDGSRDQAGPSAPPLSSPPLLSPSSLHLPNARNARGSAAPPPASASARPLVSAAALPSQPSTLPSPTVPITQAAPPAPPLLPPPPFSSPPSLRRGQRQSKPSKKGAAALLALSSQRSRREVAGMRMGLLPLGRRKALLPPASFLTPPPLPLAVSEKRPSRSKGARPRLIQQS